MAARPHNLWGVLHRLVVSWALVDTAWHRQVALCYYGNLIRGELVRGAIVHDIAQARRDEDNPDTVIYSKVERP